MWVEVWLWGWGWGYGRAVKVVIAASTTRAENREMLFPKEPVCFHREGDGW